MRNSALRCCSIPDSEYRWNQFEMGIQKMSTKHVNQGYESPICRHQMLHFSASSDDDFARASQRATESDFAQVKTWLRSVSWTNALPI
jgi:hypothetical protein